MEYVRGFTGRIMWLPVKSEVDEDLRPQIDDAAYDHPVMCLSPRRDAHDRVKVLMVTSFGGEAFVKVHKSPERRAGYLPIWPCDEHPDTRELLKLDNECPSMRKKSYVNTKQIHDMYFTILEEHLEYGRDRFLDQVSYVKVAGACGYRAPAEASLEYFVKPGGPKNSGKAKKTFKGVDTPRETSGQEKEPAQDIHPHPPLADTVDVGQGQSYDGNEDNGKSLKSVFDEVGAEDLVALPIEGNTSRTNDGVSAALTLVDNILDKRDNVPTAVTLYANEYGTVGTDHRRLDPPSSAASSSSGSSSSISSSERGSAFDAEDTTPGDFPAAIDVPAPDKDSLSVKKVTTALAPTDKNTAPGSNFYSGEESLSDSSSETDSTTFSIVSSTSRGASDDGQPLNSAELSGDNSQLLGVVSCAALLACVLALSWVYWGFPGV